MILGVIPAAGKSTRLGQNKLALSVAGRLVIEHVIAALRGGGVERVLVVLSEGNAQLVPTIEAAGATALVLEHATPHMRETLEAGLAWWQHHHAPPRAWMMCPGDYPAIGSAVVQQLLAAFRLGPSDAVFVPSYQGRSGHPVLLGWQHVEGLMQFHRPAGLNVYIRQQTVVEVPVNWPGILYDLDTPEDLARLCSLLADSEATFPASSQ